MSRMLIAYFSRSGETEKMAQQIGEGARREGVDAVVREIPGVTPTELYEYDGIVIGTPVYYGSMSWEIKKLFDESVVYHGRLEGKVGAAFCSCAKAGGGSDAALEHILNAMLIHGMIIQGDPLENHLGALSVGSPDERALKQCARMGQRVARLIKKLSP